MPEEKLVEWPIVNFPVFPRTPERRSDVPQTIDPAVSYPLVDKKEEKKEPQKVEVANWPEPQPVKGDPIRVFNNAQANGLADKRVDCTGFNAVHVEITVSGTTPSATISLEGAAEEGGVYLPLPHAVSLGSVTSSIAFDAVVGSRWVTARIANIAGTFGSGLGYTVTITPYASPVSDRHITVFKATGTGAISLTTTNARKFKLLGVTCHMNTAPTTSQNLTVTLNGASGAAYNTVLNKQDLSVGSVTDFVYTPSQEQVCEAGDEIAVTYTNTDGRTYGVRIVCEAI